MMHILFTGTEKNSSKKSCRARERKTGQDRFGFITASGTKSQIIEYDASFIGTSCG